MCSKKIGLCAQIMITILGVVELSIKFLEEGQNHGFDHSFREISNKSTSTRHVFELVFNVG